MLQIDLTNAIDRLIDGKGSITDQKLCGTVLRQMLIKPKVAPNYSKTNGKPYCPNCEQPLNIKMRNGKNIFEYCKCCGQAIDWNELEDKND